MIRFYAPDIEAERKLPEEESKHCIRVLRHSIGDSIDVVDGKGHVFHCIITDDNPKHTGVKVKSTDTIGNPWKGTLTIGIAPTKNPERMEWLIEKLTEIGVDNIIPMECARSERRALKTDRLERKIVSAMMQSLKTVKPILSEMTPFKDIIGENKRTRHKFICYCDEILGKEGLWRLIENGTDTIILIGPEGDFSEEEVREALDNGFQPVSLGPCRLRTETAAFVAADTFHIASNICRKQPYKK